MNIEQLKLIIEMLNGLGAGTKDVVMLYLGAEYILKPAFVVAGIAGGLWGCSKIITSVMHMGEDNRYLQEIRDRLGVGTRGYFCRSELKPMLDKIAELKEKAK